MRKMCVARVITQISKRHNYIAYNSHKVFFHIIASFKQSGSVMKDVVAAQLYIKVVLKLKLCCFDAGTFI